MRWAGQEIVSDENTDNGRAVPREWDGMDWRVRRGGLEEIRRSEGLG